jgi:hypothetical protein
MLTDMHVLESDGMILDVPAEQAEATCARLEQFLFSEDVKLGSLVGALTTCGAWPGAPRRSSSRSIGAAGLAGRSTITSTWALPASRWCWRGSISWPCPATVAYLSAADASA